VAGEAQVLVLPAARHGVSPYVGLGLACTMVDARHSLGALTLTAGIEAAEGNRVGWYVEGGAAAGARLAVGIRWRRFPAWWR
jgi:opacity protein-like surface antigen